MCGDTEGTRPLPPRLPPQHPPPLGKQGQEERSLKRLLAERSPPVPLALCSFFQLPPLFHKPPLLFLYSHISIPFLCTHSLSPHSRCCFIFPFLLFLPPMLLLPTFSPRYTLCFHMLWGKHHLLPYFLCLMLAALCHCSLRLFSISSHLSCSHPLFLVSCADEWPRKPKRQSLPLSPHPHKVPHQDLVPAPRRESRSRDFTATPNPKKHLRFGGG